MMFLTIPGHLGITGMNNRAVSINCNTLMQLDYGKTGLPVTFVVRGVVGKDTQEEALAFLKEIRHLRKVSMNVSGLNPLKKDLQRIPKKLESKILKMYCAPEITMAVM